MSEAVQCREAAIGNEQKAMSDLNEQVARANEAQDKYDFSLIKKKKVLYLSKTSDNIKDKTC